MVPGKSWERARRDKINVRGAINGRE